MTVSSHLPLGRRESPRLRRISLLIGMVNFLVEFDHLRRLNRWKGASGVRVRATLHHELRRIDERSGLRTLYRQLTVGFVVLFWAWSDVDKTAVHRILRYGR